MRKKIQRQKLKSLFIFNRDQTLKKFIVEPPSKTPYLMTVCLARSSADSIGFSKVSTVKNAAKFAVYDAIIIKVKKYHIPAKSLWHHSFITLKDKYFYVSSKMLAF